MNFSNQFLESWNSRFPSDSEPPLLDCLKADHFGSLLDQKQSLEFQEFKHCSLIEELKHRLDHETFVAEFLHKCIQKLTAVSQVFNEFDHSDSKSSSSNGTPRLPAVSSCSPPLAFNGSFSNQTAKISSTACSSFSLLPQCLASSLIRSAASPLLAAAAATSTGPLFLPNSLPPFSCPGSIKLEPEHYTPTDGPHASSSLPSSSQHHTPYDSISRLSGHNGSIYNHNTSTSSAFNGSAPILSTFNTSSGGRAESQCQFDAVAAEDCDETQLLDYRQIHRPTVVSSEAQAHAAAAVVAAFGLGFREHGGTKSLQSVVISGDSASQIHHPLPNGMDKEHFPVLDSSAMAVDRPYQCSLCSRSFAVKAGLVQHMRTHTDERPYPCPHCGRAFKQKIQLTTHIRVHSGERPYGCRLCGKLFRQQSHVVQHLRTHTGEKPHKCYQCGKAFRQKYSLISHQRRLCRNRSAANPIAAGMTMWISPGVSGGTGSLVKEFSHALKPDNLASPTSEMNSSAHSPCSPVLSPIRRTVSPFKANTLHRLYPSFSERHSQSQHLPTSYITNNTVRLDRPRSSTYVPTPVNVANSTSPMIGQTDMVSDEENDQSSPSDTQPLPPSLPPPVHLTEQQHTTAMNLNSIHNV